LIRQELQKTQKQMSELLGIFLKGFELDVLEGTLSILDS
jgi:hypothetical protein